MEKDLAQEFRTGDVKEQVDILRSLNQLDHPSKALDLAIYATRTNTLPIFEAIACENDYPVKYFPQQAWNQMILKLLFLDLDINRVVGWQKRMDRALLEQADAYFKERILAGRHLPSSYVEIQKWRSSC